MIDYFFGDIGDNQIGPNKADSRILKVWELYKFHGQPTFLTYIVAAPTPAVSTLVPCFHISTRGPRFVTFNAIFFFKNKY